MKTCPLCKSAVLYHGLFDLECAGKGCQNYKASPLKSIEDWKVEFDDTLIEWDWFMGFVEWLGEKSGRKLVPVCALGTYYVTEPVLGVFFGVATNRKRKEIPERLREYAPWLSEIL